EEATGLIGFVDKALGYDHAAVAKGQLVALMREIVALRSDVAMMAARLDAEVGAEDVDMQAIDERVRESLAGERFDAGIDNINAEPTIDAPAAETSAADSPAASEKGDAQDQPLAIAQINVESIANAGATSTNGRVIDQNERVPGWERARRKLAPFVDRFAV